jgi:uncharacterized damage-inducible protein DinB
MQETPQQYTQRILSHSQGQDSLRLQQTAPAKLAKLIKGKTKAQLQRRPAPDKWSVAEILAHLADAETVISWRIRQVLGASGQAIQAYDQNVWARTFEYAKRDARQSLATYTALREANVALLKRIPKKLWDNYGIHSERGQESVTHIVNMVAGHDINHRLQVEAIVKARR